jgi:hypothetical protein
MSASSLLTAGPHSGTEGQALDDAVEELKAVAWFNIGSIHGICSLVAVCRSR